jgi:hypothetical protein
MTDGVLRLVKASVDDVLGMMEATIADIRDGKIGDVRHGAAVFISDEGEITVFGWGSDADDIRSAGLLSMGVAWLSRFKVVRKT